MEMHSLNKDKLNSQMQEEKDALVARGALGVLIYELVDTEQLFDRFFIKLTKIIDNAYYSTVQY